MEKGYEKNKYKDTIS